MKSKNTDFFETEMRYYDSRLGIDGSADELASYAIRYTEDYSDEALLRIIEILKSEKKEKDALRVSLELESRHEVASGKRDLGRLKLWALDGMYELIDSERDGKFELTLINELKPLRDETERAGHLVLHIESDSGESATDLFTWSEFKDMTADDFERRVNEIAFYAQ